MPNRIIREQILTSHAVNQLSPEAEIFYRRLMSIVDDYGRYEADPEILRARLYPLQLSRTSADICGQLTAECGQVLTTDREPLVRLYTINGRKYLQISNFGQRRRTQSKFPPPSADICGHLTTNDSGCPPSRSRYSESESESYSNPTREDTPSTEFLRWAIDMYPVTMSDLDVQLMVSIVNTPEKMARLRQTLPMWKKSRRWSTFPMSAKKFFGEGYWDKEPKEPEEDNGF